MRRVRQVSPDNTVRWLDVPDQIDLDAAWLAGYNTRRDEEAAQRRASLIQSIDSRAVLIAARELMATLTPDPPEVIAERRKELASW